MFPLCQDNKEVLDAKKQLEKQKSDASKRGTPTQNYGCIICESHKLRTASNHSTKDCKFLSEYKPPTDRITTQTRQTLVIFATYTGGGTMGRKFAGHYLILSHNRHLLQGPMRTPEEIVIKVMIDTNVTGTTTVTKNGTQTKHVDITETQPRSHDYEDRRPNDYEQNQRNEYPRNSYRRQNDDPGPPPNPRRMYYQGYQPYQEPERDLPRYLTEEDVNKKLEEYMKNHPKN